jgi:hypothetical protein
MKTVFFPHLSAYHECGFSQLGVAFRNYCVWVAGEINNGFVVESFV